jgi:hypothetical protein
MSFQARQGDIYFRVVDSRPAKVFAKNDNIIAYGEVTGHAHKIMDPPMSELDSYVDENGDIFVRSNTKDITIEHDEHDTITLPANQWIMITRQREYDALAVNRERQVAD